MTVLTPRRRGVEFLDNPAVDARVAERSMRDIVRSNTLLGGTHAVVATVIRALRDEHLEQATLLDVGTGLGDIPARVRARALRLGIAVRTFGLELNPALACRARSPALPVVRGSVLALPFRSGSVDIVTCSQVLHHFDAGDSRVVLRELNRVARRCVIVSDLRRSWVAAAGIWLASFPLRFHTVSRHDGVISVLRGFTRTELEALVRNAVSRDVRVRRRPPWRHRAARSPKSAVRE
jgi:2-polyprenyl-3-methyl-5-hydroxy-6-metoxy-1,4-benzoquinol methylase